MSSLNAQLNLFIVFNEVSSFWCCYLHHFLFQTLESSNALIIEFQEDAEKAAWLKELVLATYRASVSVNSYSWFIFVKLSKFWLSFLKIYRHRQPLIFWERIFKVKVNLWGLQHLISGMQTL